MNGIGRATNKIVAIIMRFALVAFFVVFAVVLIFFGTSMKRADKNKAVFGKTEATITDVKTWEESDDEGNIETVGEVTFEYTVDDEKYGNTKSYSSGESVGDVFELYYNPEDPTDIIVGDTSIGNYLLIAGCVFAFIALITLVKIFIGKNSIFG